MYEFIDSLTNEQKAVFGKHLVDSMRLAIVTKKVDTAGIAVSEAIAKLLYDYLSIAHESEGYYEYISRTARQVAAGMYGSIGEIQEELDTIVASEEGAKE